jgi:hypothetical protein
MVTMPESMDECFYFSRRSLENNGKVVAWVHKPLCPSCSKAKMGKPQGKDGSIKIRAKEYACPSCKYTVDKEEFEPTLTMEVQFTCPSCKKPGETATPYKRKKFKGVDAYVFDCTFCKEKIPITKKMKDIKD